MDCNRCNGDPCASPSRWRAAKKRGAETQALGRSRGGFGTKIHAVVDALDLPVRFEIGPSQQNDMAPACKLVEGVGTGDVLADRAYDADSLYDTILDQGGRPVIPPRRHHKYQHKYDKTAYRNRVEGFFAKIIQWRRIATKSKRREKPACHVGDMLRMCGPKQPIGSVAKLA